MPLTALILPDDPDLVFAVLGVPVVEFQIRRAAAHGAQHFVVMVRRMPPSLLATLDRLRREGMSIDIARDVTDVVDFVHPDDRVLLLALRIAIADADLRRLAASDRRLALAVAPGDAAPRFDIIDAAHRWTGWASFDGRFLREVAVTIGDWDLAPTVLRKLLQSGGAAVMAQAPVAPLDQPADRAAFEAGLRTSAAPPVRGIGEQGVVAPVAAIAARFAADAGMRAEWIAGAGAVVGLAALVLGIAGWSLVATVLSVTALIAARTASVLAIATRSRPLWRGALALLPDGLGWLLLLAIGVSASHVTGQWGCTVLAAVAVAALLLLRTPLIRERPAALLADTASSLLVAGLGAALAAPALGLAIAAAHAALSVGLRQAALGPRQS